MLLGSPAGPPPRSPPLGVSVVIPTLDEEARIGPLLEELGRLAGIDEVIVVDGGSRDRTGEIVRALRWPRLLVVGRGRGLQLNAGAAAARSEVVLFLHADVHLPDDAMLHVAAALADPGVVAGAFRTWTVADAGTSVLAPLLHLADLRSRWTGLPYGDQAIFVRSDVLRAIGGVPELPLLEDLELSRRLRRRGRIHTCRASVTVSGRRFLARPVWYTLLVNVIPLLARLGMSSARLAKLYGSPR